jgi:hypothetical protein
MAIQTKTGKAFEYALLRSFYERLQPVANVSIVQNTSFENARACFEEFSAGEKADYLKHSAKAVEFLLELEPRLSNGTSAEDVLQLEIAADSKGQSGDVRDVLLIRALQKWEIGVSAKNNHRAVKHSRLSLSIDFGEKWLGLPCSAAYFEEIRPIFEMLDQMKKANRSTRWDSIENRHLTVYAPILKAFRKELFSLYEANHEIVAQRLVEYLIGNRDFYKVIKSNEGRLEIEAYNFHDTLNQPFLNIKPKAKIPRLKLPDRLIEIVFEKNSATTLLVSLNEGWQISFRIHNAKSTVEPSLKFDINLVSGPNGIFLDRVIV